MRLSSLRTPPRSGAITPILASGRSTPSDVVTPSKHPHTFSFDSPEKQRGSSSRTSPRSPQLKSPQDKKQKAEGRQCVCELCTCGMHSCQCKPKLAFEGTSTSREMHRKFSLPSAPPSQPKLMQPHSFLPFEGESSYKREFIEKDLPRHEHQQLIIEPPLPLNAESSYTRDYTVKELERRVPAEVSPRPQQPFFGDTSYREFYAEKPLPERKQRPKSAEGMRRRPWEEPLGGTSTYNMEYDKKELPPPEPPAIFEHNPLPFEGESSYKRSYTQKELPKQPAPVQMEKPSQVFYGETTYGKQYPKREMPKNMSRKKSAPASVRCTWQEPLEGRSTYKSEFTEKPLPNEPKPDMPNLETVRFQGESSYKRDFVEKELRVEVPAPPPQKPAQPFYGETSYRKYHDGKTPVQIAQRSKSSTSSSARPWADPLGGMSTYKQDFIEKQVPREEPPKYVIEPAPRFDGESSYKRDFTQKPIHLEKQQAPSPRPQQPFFGETSYRNSYTEKHAPSHRKSSKAENGKRPAPWNDPLNAVSSYDRDYVVHPISAEAPRQQQPPSGPDTRDFSTTYGNTFVPKESHVCPVTRMPQCPHHAPVGRDHSFWDQDKARWC